MSVIIGFDAKKNTKKISSLRAHKDGLTAKTVTVPMAGISYYPGFAAKDFERAQERFHLASGLEKATTPGARRQASVDREAHRDLVHLDLADPELVLDTDQIDAFVLRVTGHPHSWLAAWSYREYIRCIMATGDLDVQEYVDQAYAAAISVG